MKLYKLTDANMQTYGDFQWVLGEASPELSGEGRLCGPGFYHVYTDPLLAVLLNPIHANFNPSSMRLFEGEGEIVADDHGLKAGVRSFRPTRELAVPNVTPEMRVRFAILCAKAVTNDARWLEWATGWLDGSDRSATKAERTAIEVWEEARGTAAKAMEWAAEAAARAARTARTEAVRAAAAAKAMVGAAAAAEAARAATTAAAAAEAARAATTAGNPFDLATMAARAVREEECDG